MSVTSDTRAALAAGLETALSALTPPASATPVPQGENADRKGCAWITKSPRTYEPRHIGTTDGHVEYRQVITYTVDFRAYREARRHMDAALAAQTRVDEMVDAFTDWLSLNPNLGVEECLSALAVSSSDEPELEDMQSGWAAGLELRVRVELHP